MKFVGGQALLLRKEMQSGYSNKWWEVRIVWKSIVSTLCFCFSLACASLAYSEPLAPYVEISSKFDEKLRFEREEGFQSDALLDRQVFHRSRLSDQSGYAPIGTFFSDLYDACPHLEARRSFGRVGPRLAWSPSTEEGLRIAAQTHKCSTYEQTLWKARHQISELIGPFFEIIRPSPAPGSPAIYGRELTKPLWKCSYQTEDVYFWKSPAPAHVTPAALKRNSPTHPLLFVGPPALECPETFREARALVLSNFEDGAVFRNHSSDEVIAAEERRRAKEAAKKAAADAAYQQMIAPRPKPSPAEVAAAESLIRAAGPRMGALMGAALSPAKKWDANSHQGPPVSFTLRPVGRSLACTKTVTLLAHFNDDFVFNAGGYAYPAFTGHELSMPNLFADARKAVIAACPEAQTIAVGIVVATDPSPLAFLIGGVCERCDPHLRGFPGSPVWRSRVHRDYRRQNPDLDPRECRLFAPNSPDTKNYGAVASADQENSFRLQVDANCLYGYLSPIDAGDEYACEPSINRCWTGSPAAGYMFDFRQIDNPENRKRYEQFFGRPAKLYPPALAEKDRLEKLRAARAAMPSGGGGQVCTVYVFRRGGGGRVCN